jgi:hypothetical protein
VADGESRTNRWRENTWHAALDGAGLAPDLDRLALVLARKSRADGTHARASHRWLAGRVGKSERTVRRWVSELIELGWIERVEKGTRKGDRVTANVYMLTVPADLSTGQPMGGPLTPPLKRPAPAPQPATETTTTGHPMDGHPPRSPSPRSSGAASPPRDEPLPADWSADKTNRAMVERIGADLANESRAFRAHHQAEASLRHDWQAAFRRWLRNVEQYGPSEPVAPLRPRDAVPRPGDTYDPAYAATLPPPRTEPPAY